MSTTLKTHSPLLINAEAMALDHPKTFKRPPAEIINAVRLRDFVKINIQYIPPVLYCKHWVSSERFWVEVVARTSNYWVGQVKSKLLTKQIEVGSLVKYHPCNIYDIAPGNEKEV